jgi:hypothetical protein
MNSNLYKDSKSIQNIIALYSPFVKIAEKLITISQAIIQFLLQSDSPRLRQFCNQNGEMYWELYNPATGKTSYFATEAEVLIWLEKHYYL